MTRQEINEVKKILGVKKQELILLHTYIKYGKECADLEDAVDFVLSNPEPEVEDIEGSKEEYINEYEDPIEEPMFDIVEEQEIKPGYVLKRCNTCGYMKQVAKKLNKDNKCPNFKCKQDTFYEVIFEF